MKLSELIIKLKEIEDAGYGEFEMQSEGCDCDGDVNDVTVINGIVYLWRKTYVPPKAVNPPRRWTREAALAYAHKYYSTWRMSDKELDELVTTIYEQV